MEWITVFFVDVINVDAKVSKIRQGIGLITLASYVHHIYALLVTIHMICAILDQKIY